MATALVPTAQVASRYDQAEVIAAIKQTVAKGANDGQLRMFLEVCRSTGLDPFLKEIWFVAEKGIIMAGRDGYLRKANEHPQFDGMETRVERDAKNVPVKATCSVWRKDRNHPITCEAYYSEYKKATMVWSQYPSAMISKVAEVLALKRSFSINGVVTEEEIGFDGARNASMSPKAVAERKLAELVEAREAREQWKEAAAQPVVEIAASVPEPQDEDRYELRDAPAAEEPAELPPAVEVEPEPAGPVRLKKVPFWKRPKTSDLEQQLTASIEVANVRKAGRLEMLDAFGAMEQRYAALDCLRTFAAILGLHGARDARDFTDDADGVQAARECFKKMAADISKREAAR